MTIKSRCNAFTIIEAMITLSIISLLFICSIIYTPKTSIDKKIDKFLGEYQQIWDAALSHAISYQKDVDFIIQEDKIVVQKENYQSTLAFDRELSSSPKNILIKSDGYVAPQTIRFKFKEQKFSIIYGMAGGSYRVEK